MIHQANTEMLVSKNKRKRKGYAEIVNEKISERKGDNQKTLIIEYKKNDDRKDLRSKFLMRVTKIV